MAPASRSHLTPKVVGAPAVNRHLVPRSLRLLTRTLVKMPSSRRQRAKVKLSRRRWVDSNPSNQPRPAEVSLVAAIKPHSAANLATVDLLTRVRLVPPSRIRAKTHSRLAVASTLEMRLILPGVKTIQEVDFSPHRSSLAPRKTRLATTTPPRAPASPTSRATPTTHSAKARAKTKASGVRDRALASSSRSRRAAVSFRGLPLPSRGSEQLGLVY